MIESWSCFHHRFNTLYSTQPYNEQLLSQQYNIIIADRWFGLEEPNGRYHQQLGAVVRIRRALYARRGHFKVGKYAKVNNKNIPPGAIITFLC